MVKISIVMPIYNVEPYLKKCIDSVLAQTFKDFELILVDDGSPDNCPRICDEYSIHDSRVNVIHKPNGGVSDARNKGIEIAVGEWAYVMDSDDWLETDALENMYNAAMESGVDCVISDCIAHYPGNPKRGRMFSKPFTTNDRETIDSIQKFILNHKLSPYYSKNVLLAGAPWSKMIHMDIAKQSDVFFDPYVKGRFDDGLWTLRILEHVKSVSYIDTVTYNWRYVETSQTNAFRPMAMDVMNRGFEKTVEFINEMKKNPAFMQAHYCRIVNFLSLQLSQYFFNENNPKSKPEVRMELKETLQSEPYKTALKNVKLRYLEMNHMYTTMCARVGFVSGLELFAEMKKRKNRLKKK